MKKIILAFALLAGTGTFMATTSQAQVSVSFNIGRQPLWGPTGYDYADYYYMPDIDAYYSVTDQQFIYMDGGQWVFRSSLPYRYRNYDLYNGYKVVVNANRPWLRNDYYRRQYWGYRGRRGQGVIRDSRDYRYYEIANHPYHNQWRGRQDERYNRQYRDDRGWRDDRGRRDDRNWREDRRDDRNSRDDRNGRMDNRDRNDGFNGGDRGGNGRMDNRNDRNDRGNSGDRNGGGFNGGDRGGNGRLENGDRNGGFNSNGNGGDRGNGGGDRGNGGDGTRGGRR